MDHAIGSEPEPNVYLSIDDQQLMLIALGFMMGALSERKDFEHVDHICKRSLEVAKRLGVK